MLKRSYPGDEQLMFTPPPKTHKLHGNDTHVAATLVFPLTKTSLHAHYSTPTFRKHTTIDLNMGV